MQTNTPPCPADDILYIIRQDSAEQLQSALLNVIHRFAPTSQVYLFCDANPSQNNSFSAKHIISPGNPGIKSQQNNYSELSLHNYNFLPTDDYVQIFSIHDLNRNNSTLLTLVTNTPQDENYIKYLIKAYNRQMELLRSKDTDSLTNIFNRQAFDSKLNKLHNAITYTNRTTDHEVEYCLALLDIDFFKKVNDKYGHIYGDEVLLIFANIMKNTFRDGDLLFRYGGEEFAVLLKDVNIDDANIILQRFCDNIKAYHFPMGHHVTVSIGYCSFNNHVPLTILIDYADKALYYAKENGRNRVCNYEKLVSENKITATDIAEGDVELFSDLHD